MNLGVFMRYYSTSEPLNFKGVEEGWVEWLYFSLRARFFFSEAKNILFNSILFT